MNELITPESIEYVRTMTANGSSKMAIANEMNLPQDTFDNAFGTEVSFIKDSLEFVKSTAACGGTSEFMARQLGIPTDEFERIFDTVVNDAIEMAGVQCAQVVLDAAKGGCVKSAAFIMQRLQWNPNETRLQGGLNKRNKRAVTGQPTGRRQLTIRKELVETVVTQD